MLHSTPPIRLFTIIRSTKVSVAILVLLFLVILKAGVYASGGIAGTDFFWHIEYAKYFISHWSLPESDWMTWTLNGKPYLITQWLGQLLIGIPFIFGGYQMSAAFTAIMVGLIVFFTWRTSMLYIKNPLLAMFVALLVTQQMWALSARPQVLGMVAFSIMVWMMSVWFEKKQIWVLIALPLLMCFWVNLHGTYSIGILYIAAVGGGAWLGTLAINGGRILTAIRHHLPLAIASFTAIFATLINPYGWRAWEYVIQISQLITTKSGYISEWSSTSMTTSNGQQFFNLILVTIGAMMLAKDRPTPQVVVGFIGTVIFGLSADRQTYFAALATTPFLANSFRAGKIVELCEEKLVISIKIIYAVFILLAACALYWPLYSFSKQVVENKVQIAFPYRALKYLNEHNIEGRLFNDPRVGGFIESTGRKAFIDGRLDLFGDQMALGWLSAKNGEPGWETFISKYDPEIFILEKSDALRQLLIISEGYRLVYDDEVNSVFLKSSNKK